MELIIEVIDIKGICPVYKVGDSFILKSGYKLMNDKPLCMHSLASLMPYYNALSKGIKPKDLGLGDSEVAYIQCLDPFHWTGGGTVTFAIKKRNE